MAVATTVASIQRPRLIKTILLDGLGRRADATLHPGRKRPTNSD
jgi:hypothetical protein